MGDVLRDALATRPLNVDLVVPVPLSHQRQRARGFNQAELLAREVVSVVGGTLCIDSLMRVERRAQRTLNAAGRIANLRGAFRARDAQAIEGKRVLIVDDVVTTGATVSACADTLAQAGAKRISVLAFARDL